MLYNIADYGLISIGSIINLSISYSRFGAVISIGGVLLSAAISGLICKSLSRNENIISAWYKWLSNLCNLCICAAGVSHFLDYFDGQKAQDYIHFMPTNTMPHLMPITVIMVLSFLFALGLEESQLLTILLCAFYSTTFGLFLLTSFGNIHFKLEFPEFQEDFMSLVLPSALLILPCYAERNSSEINTSKGITISCINYLLITIILGGMSKIKCKLYGLLCPLNKLQNWYEPVEVMLLTCTLALAAYSLYLPCLKVLLHSGSRYFSAINKENKFTGTSLYAILIIGTSCSMLVYLYSSYQLMMIGSTAFVIGNCLSTVLTLNDSYQPEYVPKLKGNIVTSSSRYEHIESIENISAEQIKNQIDEEEALSDDSGHSSETDIDAEVADYKEKVKILNPFGQDRPQPTLQTGGLVTVLLIFIALLSFLGSQALQNNQMITTALLILGIICWAFIIFYQPSLKNETDNYKMSFLFSIASFVGNIFLLGSVNSQIWFDQLLWLLAGCLFWIQSHYGNSWFQSGKEKVQYFFKDVPSPLISTECHMVQTTVPISPNLKLQEPSPY
ncbi:uncharacterized protein isoform X2 [Rhodnius prolixus]|uniref:uncharacterized protein isoform X2 n=1 Tax=Rhodnius prolixus TaxID=13249 RepID=UPI003D187E6A